MGRYQGSRGWKGRGCPQPEKGVFRMAEGCRWRGKELRLTPMTMTFLISFAMLKVDDG